MVMVPHLPRLVTVLQSFLCGKKSGHFLVFINNQGRQQQHNKSTKKVKCSLMFVTSKQAI